MGFKETELGRLPSQWSINTIGDSLSDIIDYRGKTPKKSKDGILTLSAKSVRNGYIDYSSAYFISKKTYDQFMVRGFPRKGDILLTTEAPLGYVAKLDRDGVGIAQRLLTLRGKKNYLDNDYLMYYLMSPIGQHQLKSRETGTTVTGIKQSEFRKIMIPIPPLKEQKAIANILSTLDEKIEVNNQINKTLEEMAQAIFKHWFVDFEFPNENGEPYKSSGGEMVESELGMIPKGWAASNVLQNIIEEKEKNKQMNDYPVLSVVKEGKFVLSDEYFNKQVYSKNTKNYKVIRKNSVGYNPARANIGSIAMLREYEAGLLSPIYKVFRLKESILPSYFYYYMRRDTFIEKIKHYSSGTTRQNFDFNAFEEFELIKPPTGIQKEFESIVTSLESCIKHNNNENKVLSEIRNTLLPKLMSGEIRVPIKSGSEIS